MRPITTKISTLALVCLLLGVGSCSREDDSQSGGKLLKVNVQMAASPMLARGATTSPIISDTVDMGNDLVLVATSRPRDYEPQEALTRGTPIKSAANLPSLNVKVYNSGTASFSGSTALTTTLKGTNSSGAWSLSPAYAITDGVKNTYMAYCPIEDAGNGITVAANGRTINYTAPTTVTSQPDLCSSTIVKDDASSNLPLAMQHRLTAVGIKAMGNSVEIISIVLSDVYSSGTLDLETGAWSNLGTKTNFTPVTTQSSLSTNGEMNDITAANGYLMLPPQSFTDNNPCIAVTYKYAGYQMLRSIYLLKNLAGGKWEAGQIVMYEIQFKSNFSLTFNPTSLTLTDAAGTASFTYSTNSPRALDPQFTNGGNAWITNIDVNRSTKKVTFSYKENEVPAARTATIKATSGWTEKDISIKQAAAIDPSSYIPRSVLAKAGWPANRLPTKGLQMAVHGNVLPGGSPELNEANMKWSTVSEWAPTTNVSLGTGKDNYAELAALDAGKYPIGQACKHLGPEWYVPSKDELLLIHTNQSLFGVSYTFNSKSYWSSSEGGVNGRGWSVLNGGAHEPHKANSYEVRCVREI